MYYEYNFSDMHMTTARLNSILDEGLSEDSIREFVNCGLNLKWKGLAAERFRNDLYKIRFMRNFNESALEELRFIANYPRMCAERMAQAENEITAKIRDIF